VTPIGAAATSRSIPTNSIASIALPSPATPGSITPRTARVSPIEMQPLANALAARRQPAPRPAGTTAALKGVALVLEQGEEEGSAEGEQGEGDSPVRRRAPRGRVAWGAAGVAVRVCKHVRVAGRRL